jgi:N-acyl-L-homoserine lactone synthetase
MLSLFEAVTNPTAHPLLTAMFAARRAVFVDLLRWDLPMREDRLEIDEFDDQHATYLIVSAPNGRHLASARLLPTLRPHLLGSLYAHLCAKSPPASSTCVEITRFCLDRSLRAAERRLARDELINGLVAHALRQGITHYSAIAETGWFEQIQRFGWRCETLSVPHTSRTGSLVAFTIAIDAQTPAALAAAGRIAADPVPTPALRIAA